MSTVDKIMALADVYADDAADKGDGWFRRAALRAAIVEALDMGEPVAWLAYDSLYGTANPPVLTFSHHLQPGAFRVYDAKP